ncbi:unnamed protein product [Microthlaspi erraticum]|uniref:DUF4283 domain-containing protein n=1 Tax=Microthlaspi erraticum TaxID=1685480 RepID=A0A6D2KMS3_9BRAS|nr:unnamed protein product [Microthlaspi erraticum]CAA7056585.1 unnamed protein product [Microthlaspi erraticum]
MSNMDRVTRHGGSSSQARRRLNLEEEIIKLPAYDMTSAAEKFKLTVIGRMFHREGRNMDAILGMLPKPKIWDVEGRARGTSLGNGQFLFDFDNEEDMTKVLGSVHGILIVTGIPVHFWNDDTFQEIGKALGVVQLIEAHRAKFQVSINADEPLQFEKKVGFPNGDTGMAKLEYVGLHRYCFTCKLLSHEEGTCPALTDDQREKNRVQRLELNQEHTPYLRGYGGGLQQGRREEIQTGRLLGHEREGRGASYRDYRDFPPPTSSRHEDRYMNARRSGIERERDLRLKLKQQRDSRGKDVWNRVKRLPTRHTPVSRERYHPYKGSYDRTRKRDTSRNNSHQMWRPRHPYNKALPNQMETPSSRVSNHNSEGFNTPVDSQRTLSARGDNEGPTDRRGSGVLVVYPKNTEEDRIRKLKGKAIETEASRAEAKRIKVERLPTRRTPVSRERYHPYKGAYDRTRERDTSRNNSHQMWRPRHPYNKALPNQMETPSSRVSNHNREGFNTPVDYQRTLSARGDNEGPTDRRGSGVLVVYPKNKEEDRIRKLKGKAIETEASRAEAKRIKDLALGRKLGSLSINEPAIGG